MLNCHPKKFQIIDVPGVKWLQKPANTEGNHSATSHLCISQNQSCSQCSQQYNRLPAHIGELSHSPMLFCFKQQFSSYLAIRIYRKDCASWDPTCVIHSVCSHYGCTEWTALSLKSNRPWDLQQKNPKTWLLEHGCNFDGTYRPLFSVATWALAADGLFMALLTWAVPQVGCANPATVEPRLHDLSGLRENVTQSGRPLSKW